MSSVALWICPLYLICGAVSARFVYVYMIDHEKETRDFALFMAGLGALFSPFVIAGLVLTGVAWLLLRPVAWRETPGQRRARLREEAAETERLAREFDLPTAGGDR